MPRTRSQILLAASRWVSEPSLLALLRPATAGELPAAGKAKNMQAFDEVAPDSNSPAAHLYVQGWSRFQSLGGKLTSGSSWLWPKISLGFAVARGGDAAASNNLGNPDNLQAAKAGAGVRMDLEGGWRWLQYRTPAHRLMKSPCCGDSMQCDHYHRGELVSLRRLGEFRKHLHLRSAHNPLGESSNWQGIAGNPRSLSLVV
jgi:hypothetical protein